MLLPGVCGIGMATYTAYAYTHTYHHSDPCAGSDQHTLPGRTGYTRRTENPSGDSDTMVPADAHLYANTLKHAHRDAAAYRNANQHPLPHQHACSRRDEYACSHRDGHAPTHQHADRAAHANHARRYANIDAYLDADTHAVPHQHT